MMDHYGTFAVMRLPDAGTHGQVDGDRHADHRGALLFVTAWSPR